MAKTPALIMTSLLVLAAAGGVWAWCWSRNVLVVSNASGNRTITVATVTVCGETYRIEEIHPGTSKQISFDVTRDSDFQVDVSFANGARLTENFGYVTGGAGAYHNRVAIDIQEDRIQGRQEH